MIQNYPSYPKRIIGKKSFTKIEAIGTLVQRGFYVGRTVTHPIIPFKLDSVQDSFKSGREVKDSTIKNGISVNLLSVYKKKDMKFSPIEDRNNPRFHIPFQFGKIGNRLMVGEYSFDRSKQYYGFEVSSLRALEIDFTYKANGIIPTSKIRFNIEHSPTMSNFWHFNIFLWGQDSNTKEWMKLESPIVSNSTFKKIACAIYPFLAEKIVMPKGLRVKKLNKKYYTSKFVQKRRNK